MAEPDSARTINIARPPTAPALTWKPTDALASQIVEGAAKVLKNDWIKPNKRIFNDAKISDPHRKALANAGDESTRVTRLHSGKPARAIRNRLMDDLADAEGEIAPYPAQRSLVAPLAGVGEGAFQALWAGQNVGLTREIDAADLVRTLAEETAARLRAFA